MTSWILSDDYIKCIEGVYSHSLFIAENESITHTIKA